MAGENPALIVRVVTNLDELKKGLGEGKVYIEQTEKEMQSLAKGAEAAGAKIVTVGTASAKTGPEVDRLKGSLTAFDGILSALGLNIGSEVKALSELSEASGKTTSQLGLIATAGLVVGAAVAGWKIGRAISEFFDLDNVIGQATAKLLGWGDAAAEAAGAKADALARASKTIGFEVLNLSTAMEINGAAMETWRSNATRSADAVKGWQGELAKVQANGDLESLTKDLASQNFSLKDLTLRYLGPNGHVEALQFFQREQAKAAAAVVDANAVMDASNKTKLHALQEEISNRKEAAKVEAAALLTTTKLWDEYYALRISHGGTANAAAIADIQRWAADTEAAASKAGTATKAFYTALAADSAEKMAAVGIDWDLFKTRSIPALQETAANALNTYNAMVASGQFFRADLDKQLEKYHQLQDAARGYGDTGVEAEERIASAQDKRNASLMQLVSSTDALAAANKKLQDASSLDIGHAARDPEIMSLLHDGWSLENAAALKLARQWGFQAKTYDKLGNLETSPSKSERVPGYAAGVQNAPGGWADVGERGPERMYVPPGANIYPSGTSGSGAQVIQLVVDGRVLTSIVNDHNTKTMKQSRQFPAA